MHNFYWLDVYLRRWGNALNIIKLLSWIFMFASFLGRILNGSLFYAFIDNAHFLFGFSPWRYAYIFPSLAQGRRNRDLSLLWFICDICCVVYSIVRFLDQFLEGGALRFINWCLCISSSRRCLNLQLNLLVWLQLCVQLGVWSVVQWVMKWFFVMFMCDFFDQGWRRIIPYHVY